MIAEPTLPPSGLILSLTLPCAAQEEVDEASFVSLLDGILPDSVAAAEAMAAHLTR